MDVGIFVDVFVKSFLFTPSLCETLFCDDTMVGLHDITLRKQMFAGCSQSFLILVLAFMINQLGHRCQLNFGIDMAQVSICLAIVCLMILGYDMYGF